MCVCKPRYGALLACSFALSAGADRPVGRCSVAVRKRPINKKEKSKGETDIISALPSKSQVMIHEPK